MKPSNLLFDIIKSLSPDEIKFFQKASSLQQGEKNYIRLFSFIASLDEYDEEAVKEKFKNETFIRHLPSEKNQLLHHILRSLRHFRIEHSVASQIYEQIKDIQLLFNKSLYKQSRKVLNHAKEQAYKYELFYYVLEIIDLEKVLIDMEAHFGEITNITIDKLIQEEIDIFKKIELHTHYEKLLSQLNKLSTRLLFVRTKADVNAIEKILEDKLLNDPGIINSQKAMITAMHVKGLGYRLLNRNDEMFDAFQSVVYLMENNPSIISEMPKSYVLAHGYIIRYYAIKRLYTDGFKTIDKLKSLWLNPEFKSTDLQIAIFSSSYINEMLLYAYIGQHDKAKNVIPVVIKGLEKYETKINEEELLRIYQVITMVYFGIGEYSKALHWINKIINSNYAELRQDIIRISKLINLIIHFELGNEDLLPYIYKSTQRFVASLDNRYRFETLFLDYFKKISLSKREGKQVNTYISFKEEMQKVFEDPYEKNALEYFNFYAWLDSKIHNISFSDAIKIRKQTSV
ncbi:MAG: hypothetical protein ACXVP0_04100 [Bacteroidia bacterium]